MLVKSKIMDVEMDTINGKPVAVVSLKVSNPMEYIVCRIWSGQVDKGAHLVYEKLIGEEVHVSLTADIYRDKLQFQLGFDDPVPLRPFQASTPRKTAAAGGSK